MSADTQDAAQDAPDRVSSRRLATRTRLLDAAREVFAAKGVHGASVEEICEAAGFTRGAFYSNYADKDELTVALLAREQARLFDNVKLHQVAGDLDATMQAVLAAQAPEPEYYLIHTELLLLGVRDREFADTARATEEAVATGVMEILQAGLDRLGLEPLVPLRDLAHALLAVNERSLRLALLDGDDDLLSLSRSVLPALLAGLTRPRATEG
ncbi:MAG: helix-turn-helix domain-containing protein [Mobilicoccus sp.]|nr:helix-turn-helix domain-containing protein [Mobilicoccus sp.]